MYHIIVNPASRSGRGIKIWNTLVPILQEKNIIYRVYFTKKIDHATHILAKLTANKTRALTLIVLGGDGTLNEVVQGITDFSLIRIAYIPTGSSNDLARDLHLEADPVKALLHILENSHLSLLDLGVVNYSNPQGTGISGIIPAACFPKRLFCVSSGIGFDADVCVEALSSRMKDFLNHIGLGKLTYLGIALKLLLSAKAVSCDIFLDNGVRIHYDRFLFIASMIHKYEGGGFMFCPAADDSDGLLDICVAGDISFLKALRILPSAFQGKHLRFKEVSSYRTKSVRIKTSRPQWVHTDGEITVLTDEITVSSSENRLQFLS